MENPLFEDIDCQNSLSLQRHRTALRSVSAVLLFLSAAFILSLTGCGRSTTDRALDRAEALMQELPDSVENQYDPKKALSIIDSIPESELKSDGLRARYAFLKTMASYKAYLPFPSDSVMNVAARYYERIKDDKKEQDNA